MTTHYENHQVIIRYEIGVETQTTTGASDRDPFSSLAPVGNADVASHALTTSHTASHSTWTANAETQYSGTVLSQLRDQKGMDLETIAQRTKISLEHLHAIESNAYRDLPARVYVRGFVTQYAKCLGLPPNRVADSYLETYDRLIANDPHLEK